MITYNGSDLILAPIAGYSDAGMRTLCFRYGAGLCYTEMVSAKGLFYGNENTAALLHTDPEEKYTGVQLFGSEPDIFAEVVRYDCIKKFPLIDINMGCPVRKITSNGEGSSLMRSPELIEKTVRAVKQNSQKTVTVKMRLGIEGSNNAIECALAAQEGGADMITVHGRTKEQLYSGNADYDAIARVKEKLTVPLCGNGDVTDRESYLKMKQTGADYVMIARGAMGRPYVFSAVKEKEYDFSVKEAVLFHIDRLTTFLPENTVMNVMKKQIACYVYGMRGNKAIKEKAFAAKTLKELVAVFD